MNISVGYVFGIITMCQGEFVHYSKVIITMGGLIVRETVCETDSHGVIELPSSQFYSYP